MKKHHPISNLGKYAHPPKTNVNLGKKVSQAMNLTPKLAKTKKLP